MPPSPPPPTQPLYPLYNTTYTLHRLSPLHSLFPSALPSYATALHEILTGSTLRGVRIGLDSSDASLSRAGALRSVTMRPLRSPQAWALVYAAAEPDDTGIDGEGEEGWGVIIEIVYEKAAYTAILLRDINAPGNTTVNSDEQFTHLPLLLTRLPPPLRATLLDFLATRFDTRASALHLPSPFLKRALGGYIDALVAGGGDVRGAVRDVVISLAVPGAEGGGELKSIDITISRDDIDGFLERGRSSTPSTTTTNTAAAHPEHEHPLWTALQAYITTHLALDLASPQVAVVKIACGAFVIAAEGRVKISAPGEGGREGAEGVAGALVSLAGRVG